ncbi:uncharacterized protein K452DRAFT_286705 [Aplosporella prunicola CBS 121167]|uniref:Uncharacterized protein n=1 Tax=Aplosporella prunicola CBS 121167 TaxID=1176127 RepID=A0A6A6BFZ3_9PEZI|nr:uncharacterized protein K452DRAFT_286705 [Aplosporella prunicola CBS 121167]KAF2143080.1 hypothetical protein K452DRAFT_286705 [Aplosporella prunicola CBS 121167]
MPGSPWVPTLVVFSGPVTPEEPTPELVERLFGPMREELGSRLVGRSATTEEPRSRLMELVHSRRTEIGVDETLIYGGSGVLELLDHWKNALELKYFLQLCQTALSPANEHLRQVKRSDIRKTYGFRGT